MKVQAILKSGKYPIIIVTFFIAATVVSLAINLERVKTRYVELATVMGRSFPRSNEVSRKFNALHGDNYVSVTEMYQPGPHIDEPSMDIATTEAMKLVVINPAYMNRIISQISEKGQGIRFRLASLKPLNPENRADRSETEALERFQLGENEVARVIRSGGFDLFHYNTPLVMADSCMECHRGQGAAKGEIGGVMTVSFSFAPFQKAIDRNVRTIYRGHLLFLGIGIVLLAGAFVDTVRRVRSGKDPIYPKSLVDSQREASSDGILVVSEQGEMVSYNRRFIEMWGVPDEVLATCSHERTLAFVRDRLLQPEEFEEKVRSLCGPRSEHYREEVHLKDGRVLALYSTPTKGKSGDYNGRTLIFREGTVDSRLEGNTGDKRDSTRQFPDVDRLKRSCETQGVLKRILQTSLLPVSLERQLQLTLDLIFDYPWLMPIRKACIFLVESDPGVLVMKAQRGFTEEVLSTCRRVSFDTCICGKAASTGNVQFCQSADEAHGVRYPGLVSHSHYCVPIASADTILGVMNVYLDAGHQQDGEEEEFLNAVASTLVGLIVRRRAEEKHQHIATAVERAGEIILITDARGKIQYVNPAFEEVTGYRKVEVIGETPRILSSGKHDAAFFRELWETIERGEVWRGRIVNRKKDGTLFHEETTISPSRDESGKIVNYVAVKHDITNEVALENQLRHAQKMEAIGQLAGGVAHDFNNILTAIIGYASFLKMRMEKDSPLESYVTNILASAERAADLTQGLLAFSRKQVVKLEALNINEAVHRVGSLITRLIGEDVELKTELFERDLVVMADSGQIEQVLVNLATNSRDAMPGGGIFSIRTREEVLGSEFERTHGYGTQGKYALIEATDTGTGMDRETMEKIFEPFFTKKEVGSGTGLGLAIVYGIVKQHGGYINVHSEPGSGTTFHIYLPLTEKDAKESKKQESSIPLVGREKILVAEDDATVRRLLRNVLEKFGYRVVEAVDGKDAVLKFTENSDDIDLLILDVVMPGKNGKEVYDELREVRSNCKVLFMSGYAADIVFKKGLVEEGLRLISKPVSPSDLLKNVRETLDGQ